MWNPIAEHVHVDLVRAGSHAHDRGDPCQGRAQGRGLGPIKVGDEGNVAVGFEVGESDDGTVKKYRQSPVLIRPNPAATEVGVRVVGTAQQALIDSHLMIILRPGEFLGTRRPMTARLHAVRFQGGERNANLVGLW